MEYLNTGKRALLHGAKVGVACAEISRIYHDAVNNGVYLGQKPWQLDKYKEQVEAWMEEMPTEEEIRELLKQVGGPTHYSQLGITEELYERSAQEAHHIRDRHTLLRALNEAK
ncbi:Glycerol-1-phosphate dehydrogenase [NAD(P)+] [compost metagenome]